MKRLSFYLQARDELGKAGLDEEGVETLKKLYDEVRALQDREREEQRSKTNQVCLLAAFLHYASSFVPHTSLIVLYGRLAS